MPTKTVLFLLFLTVIAGLLGYNYFVQPFRPMVEEAWESAQVTPSPSPSLSPDEAWLESLSDQEKVSFVLAAPLTVDDQVLAELGLADQTTEAEAPEATTSGQLELELDSVQEASPAAQVPVLDSVLALKPGAVTLFGDRISSASAQAVITRLRSSVPEPGVLIAVDHEGGRVQRLSGAGFTFLPSWQQTCQFSDEKQQELYQATAQELAAVGIDLVFGPMVEYAQSNQVLGNRVCASDAGTVITETQPLLAAYQAVGITPVIKHFPGIGATTRDLHTEFETIEVTPTDAQVYRQLLDDNPRLGVMTSHVGVANQFPDVPCSLSSACVGQISRNYPTALIVTDALEMDSAGHLDPESAASLSAARNQPVATVTRSLGDRAIAALEAGNHVLVFGPSVSVQDLAEVQQALLERYQTTPAFQQKLDQTLLFLHDYLTQQPRVSE